MDRAKSLELQGDLSRLGLSLFKKCVKKTRIGHRSLSRRAGYNKFNRNSMKAA